MEQNENLRKTTTRKKIALAIVPVLVAALVIGLFAGLRSPDNAYAAWSDGTIVTYKQGEKQGMQWTQKFVTDGNTTADVFCMNENSNMQDSGRTTNGSGSNAVTIDYSHRTAYSGKSTDNSGYTYVQNAVNYNKDTDYLLTLQGAKLDTLLKKVLYYGYIGNDPLGLFQKFNDDGSGNKTPITKTQLYELTQAAVYRVTHYGNAPLTNQAHRTGIRTPNLVSWDDVQKLLDVAYDDNYATPGGELNIYFHKTENNTFIAIDRTTPREGQHLIGGEFTPPAEISTSAGTDATHTTESDGAVVVELSSGQDKVTLGTVWDSITYENLSANTSYSVTTTIKDEAGNVIKSRDDQQVSTGNSTSGTWDGSQLGTLQMWNTELSEGTYYYDVVVKSSDGSVVVVKHDGKNDPSEQIKVVLPGGSTTTETVNLTVTKEWLNAAGTAAASENGTSARFQVQADGRDVSGQVATVNADNNWTFTFKDLPKYQSDGTTEIKYSIVETEYAPTDKFDKGEVTADANDPYKFTAGNTEKPDDSNPSSDEYTASIKLKKELKGAALSDDQFEFEITAQSATDKDGNTITDIPLPNPTRVKNKANGDIDFGTITYTVPGTYIYEVKEIIPDDIEGNGIEYDQSTKTVTVKIGETNENGGAE